MYLLSHTPSFIIYHNNLTGILSRQAITTDETPKEQSHKDNNQMNDLPFIARPNHIQTPHTGIYCLSLSFHPFIQYCSIHSSISPSIHQLLIYFMFLSHPITTCRKQQLHSNTITWLYCYFHLCYNQSLNLMTSWLPITMLTHFVFFCSLSSEVEKAS